MCRQHADRLQVTALSVNSSTSELVAAAREFSVPAVAVADAPMAPTAVLQELPEARSSALARRPCASSHAAMMSTACSWPSWALPVSRRACCPDLEQASCLGQQGVARRRWRSAYAVGAAGSAYPGRLRAFCHLPVLSGRESARGSLHLAYLLGRPVLWPHA